MSALGFIVIAFMLTMYVMLDGYDLGVAAIAPGIARSDAERAAAIAGIGPFWSGNEVWLIAAGAALFALFPTAYASAFSGFYLPLIVVLWLLMFRGIAIELRDHFGSELWHQFWDAAFSISSALLIVILGVALGNLLRGVPLDAAGYFLGTFAFLLNPYALLVGLFALSALMQHGALFLAVRIDGGVGERARRAVLVLWWSVVVLYVLVTAMTFRVHPLTTLSWPIALSALSLGAQIAIRWYAAAGKTGIAFGASCGFIATLLAAAAATIYPYLLPSFPAGHGGISVFSAAPSSASVASALAITLAGIALVALYAPAVWRRMAEKVRVE
ncbi:MAG: cytochrome d ubiquinol oxidase subunit II [Candidatus Eremiobacteraeota bacterium]|nr:cytochrome d ubiquinol oxidase subunit II [Candidatus Eremiobacteraeota bacterium]